ncbi:MAG: thiol:disulfide interchange protein DsbA/DsbL [Burkholderiales bacterium]|nr:thiol:disulfide interchange protein DsbA/DsbL [Burkholderiales bacterium]
MNRRRALLAALPALPLATGLFAQEAVRARQNIEYRLIEPAQPVETGERIEVIDFFWYGCPYCNQLLPFLEAWIKARPPDVAVRRVPAILRESWAPHARIFYTLELLDEVERLHTRVFHGYHVEELHMSKPDVMEKWAVANGIDRRRWVDAYFSPEIDGRISRAARATKAYRVEGTPSLVADGRYITSGSMVSSLKDMIVVLDDLVRLARQQRGR